MAIMQLSKDAFVQALHDTLSPSGPIQSVEHLFGRDKQLREIDAALAAPGRHIFIYGDRGVGKTSLAQTAAFAQQAADRGPILIGCNRNTTFAEVVAYVTSHIDGAQPAAARSTTIIRKFAALGIELGRQESLQAPAASKPIGFLDAVASLHAAAPTQAKSTLVVIDEFDVLPETEKQAFSDLIKQVGDLRLGLKFILCGIGDSLDDLLGAHASCFRYLEGIQVPRLLFDARMKILDSASEALGVRVPESQQIRISAISDGFPHYVHLLAEKLFWEAFNADHEVRETSSAHYIAAISAATRGIQQQLKRAYDKATMKETDDFHFILWAVADHPNLVRRRTEIWQSYLRVMKLLEEQPLNEDQFARHLDRLKSPSCGRILKAQAKRVRGWYQFSENILRGYVRLRAEDEGVPLATDYAERSNPELTIRMSRLKPVRGWRRLYSR